MKIFKNIAYFRHSKNVNSRHFAIFFRFLVIISVLSYVINAHKSMKKVILCDYLGVVSELCRRWVGDIP